LARVCYDQGMTNTTVYPSSLSESHILSHVLLLEALESLRRQKRICAYRIGEYIPARAVPEHHLPIPNILRVDVLQDGAKFPELTELYGLLRASQHDPELYVDSRVENDAVYWDIWDL
jgi:hypothetical protein